MTDTAPAVRDRLAIALDVNDLATAVRLAKQVRPHVGVAKVGLELFSTAGADAVAAMRDLGMAVFVDVKLHDIPNTVNKAARVLGKLGARYLTLHASGGEDMLRAGIEGLAEGADAAGLPVPMALAVTILTSDTDAPDDLLRQRVGLAVAAGCPGVICAVGDLRVIKLHTPNIVAVTPGIHPTGVASHDQARTATPAIAIADGADVLVVGRAISGAPDPAAAAEAIAAEVATALSVRA